MTKCETMLQIQSNLLGIPVVKPNLLEATAFGAAFVAGLAVGVFSSETFHSKIMNAGSIFESNITNEQRDTQFIRWKKAVERSFDWV